MAGSEERMTLLLNSRRKLVSVSVASPENVMGIRKTVT